MMMFEVSLDAFANYLYLKLKKLITKKKTLLKNRNLCQNTLPIKADTKICV